MILVQGIGMSGYVPLEGIAGLYHILAYCRSDKCKCRYGFKYLGVGWIDKTFNLDVLRSVVSFAVARFFDDRVRSIITHDVGLLSGYYSAGVVFPNRLLHVLTDIMNLSEYNNLVFPLFHPRYSCTRFSCTSAWAEYVCLDPDVSNVSRSPIIIRKLAYKGQFPSYMFYELSSYVFHELRHVLSR
jgi:hypothetical protein